jgi:hypothetical protein
MCLWGNAPVLPLKRASRLRVKGCGLFIYTKSCRLGENGSKLMQFF